VLIGFRPLFRGQPRGTFKLVFNAIHAAAARRGAEIRSTEDREGGPGDGRVRVRVR
jgi:hypothetical protein